MSGYPQYPTPYGAGSHPYPNYPSAGAYQAPPPPVPMYGSGQAYGAPPQASHGHFPPSPYGGNQMASGGYPPSHQPSSAGQMPSPSMYAAPYPQYGGRHESETVNENPPESRRSDERTVSSSVCTTGSPAFAGALSSLVESTGSVELRGTASCVARLVLRNASRLLFV